MINAYDISSYQADIDNSITAGSGVIIKATEGTTYINPAMNSQIKSAKKGNKLIGLYYFANGGDYKKAANFFLRIAKPYLKNAIIVLDYEGAAVLYGKTTWAYNWLEYVYKKTGIKPLIYLGLSDENAYNWKKVAKKYNLWFAQYDTMNVSYGFNPYKKLTYGKVKHWKKNKIAMYQYTSTGIIKGYAKPIDLDVYYGTKNDWIGHQNNDTKDSDFEMTWHPKLPVLAMGAICITKKGKTTTVWDSPDVTKRKDTGIRLPYGNTYQIYDVKNAFVKVSKNKEQWVDNATGNVKQNKLYFNHSADCTVVVTKVTRGYADVTGKPTGRTFKKGEKYKTFCYKNGFLQVGAGKNKYLPASDVKIIL